MEFIRLVSCNIFRKHKPDGLISISGKGVSTMCKHCRRELRPFRGRWFDLKKFNLQEDV